MTVQRAIRWSAFGAGALLLSLAPSAATAQSGISDVIMHGRAHGVELPASTIEWMRAQGPDAFEFERRGVWKGRVARIAERRAAFDAAARQRPVRGATAVVTSQELQRAGAALDGTFRMPILLGRPSDGSSPNTAADYQDRLFGSGAGTYSLTGFYAEMSAGLFEFTGATHGWFSLPQTSSFYYNNPNPQLNDLGRTPEFLQHVLAAADPAIDFGLFDNDGPDRVPNSGDDDGYVDLAAFMYSSSGRECGTGNPGIWAHRWVMSAWGVPNYTTTDPSANGGSIRVRDYIIQGGHDCNSTSLVQVGLVAHEAGHGFGLPDFYDTCTGSCSDGSSGSGIGEWGLMGSGNWNQSHSPAHMMAFSKAFLGWIDVVTIQRDTALTIEPILNSRTAYRVSIPNAPHEYFLLENRQRLGSDVFLNGPGLLIWHVDSIRYETRRSSNRVNADASHKGVDLEEADGRNDLDAGTGSCCRGDAGDPWPGTSNRTSFYAASTPNSNTYGTGASNITIENIVQTGAGDITLFVNVPDMVTYGDVNGDDAVTLADLDIVMSYVAGATGPDFSTIGIGDVDDDNDVDARDAYIIHAYLEGRSTSGFRVGQLGIE